MNEKRGVDMPLLQERIYTTKDIYELPDGERAELIDFSNVDNIAPYSV